MSRPADHQSKAFARIQISVAAIALVTLTASGAFARLGGQNWFADETYIRVNGKTSTPNDSGKFCVRELSGKLECKIYDYRTRKPDYYLLECERNRRSCEGTIAVLLPAGDPWLAKREYRILQWTPEHVIAVSTQLHPCTANRFERARSSIYRDLYKRRIL